MDQPWTPTLRLDEVGGRCRLSLDGLSWGHGDTLQEAADDLVARLLNLVDCIRSSGLQFSTECPPPDPRWLQYLWDLGDIRERIFVPRPGRCRIAESRLRLLE